MEFIIGIVALVFGYFFILKPLFINPFQEGLRGEAKSYQRTSFSNSTKYQSTDKDFDPLKDKGDAFERFIVKKFDRKYFKIKDWRSDKFADGIYAESSKNPDFEIEYAWNNISSRFAVECKYRSKIYDNVIIADQHKIDHYKKYSREKRMPVFIALGLGGQPHSPEECYVIPLRHVQHETMDYTDLQRFKRYNPHKGFFFDHYNEVLT